MQLLHGIRLSAPWSLAGATPTSGAPELTLVEDALAVPHEAVVGDILASVGPDDAPMLTIVRAEPSAVVTARYHGVCDVRFVDAERIDLRRHPDGDGAILKLLAAGAVLATWIDLFTADVALHASAVVAGGRCLAFAGPSGSGKSTFAASAASAGAAVVSDDVLRVQVEGAPACHRGAPTLRLRPGAEALEHTMPVVEATRAADGRLSVETAASERETMLLDAIIRPRIDPAASGIRLHRASPPDALAMLAACPRISWRDSSARSKQFAALATLARKIPVFEATVPSARASFLTAGAQVVEQVLSELR